MDYQQDTRAYHARVFCKDGVRHELTAEVKEPQIPVPALTLCEGREAIPLCCLALQIKGNATAHLPISWTQQQRINQCPDSTSNAAREILALLKPVGFFNADFNSARVFIYYLLSKMLAVIT